MSNHQISHGKTLFDVFNLINPNCYQAFIIQCIIENKKEEAIQYCDELSTAFEYYNWDKTGKQSSYTDSLICESNLEKWQKVAIIHIISNDVFKCKETIKSEIRREEADNEKRAVSAKKYDNHRSIDDLYKLFGFNFPF